MSDIPQWALERTRAVIGNEGNVFEAFARYVAVHEAPPSDPDELAVIAVVKAYIQTTDETDFDQFDIRCTDMQAALAAYREHKA